MKFTFNLSLITLMSVIVNVFSHWNYNWWYCPPLTPAPSDTFRISLRTNTYLMVDIRSCLTAGYGMRCGRLYLANGESRPSIFKYDSNLDTLEYIYDGNDDRLAYGRFCLTAEKSDETPCGTSDCSLISIVRTDENSCRDYPNTQRFNLKIDNVTKTVRIVVSADKTVTVPVLQSQDINLPVVNEVRECLEVGLPTAVTTGQFQFTLYNIGHIVLGFLYNRLSASPININVTAMIIIESVATNYYNFEDWDNAVFIRGKGVGRYFGHFVGHSVQVIALPEDESNLLYYNEKVLIRASFNNNANSTDGYYLQWHYDGSKVSLTRALCNCTDYNVVSFTRCPDGLSYRIQLPKCGNVYLQVDESRALDILPNGYPFPTNPRTIQNACFRVYSQGVNINNPPRVSSPQAEELAKKTESIPEAPKEENNESEEIAPPQKKTRKSKTVA